MCHLCPALCRHSARRSCHNRYQWPSGHHLMGQSETRQEFNLEPRIGLKYKICSDVSFQHLCLFLIFFFFPFLMISQINMTMFIAMCLKSPKIIVTPLGEKSPHMTRHPWNFSLHKSKWTTLVSLTSTLEICSCTPVFQLELGRVWGFFKRGKHDGTCLPVTEIGKEERDN